MQHGPGRLHTTALSELLHVGYFTHRTGKPDSGPGRLMHTAPGVHGGYGQEIRGRVHRGLGASPASVRDSRSKLHRFIGSVGSLSWGGGNMSGASACF